MPEGNSAAKASGRVAGLDVLRFVAVSLVFFRHLQLPGTDYGWVNSGFEFLQRGGWVGVDLFFVLSGFLISGLLFREWQKRKQVSVVRFLIRRGLKIYPAFWALMIYTGIYYAIAGPPDYYRTRYLVGELLFLQNYLGSLWAHTWSLAVEEHFYLLFAFCVAVAVRKSAGNGKEPFEFIPAFAVWVAGGCLAMRLLTAVVVPWYQGRLIMYASHLRVDSLMFGVLISYLWHFHFAAGAQAVLRRMRFPLLGFGLLFLAPAFLYDHKDHRWITIFGLTLFYLGAGCLLVGTLKALENKQGAVLRGISFLGAHSYSVYLWHVVALALAQFLAVRIIGPARFWPLYSPLAFCLMWALGVGAAKLVEIPVLRLRDRWFPSAAPAV